MRTRRRELTEPVRGQHLLYVRRNGYRYPVAVFVCPGPGGDGWVFKYRAGGMEVYPRRVIRG